MSPDVTPLDLSRLYVNATLHGVSANEAAVLAAMVESYPDQPDWARVEVRAKIGKSNLRRVKRNLAARGILTAPDDGTVELNTEWRAPRTVSGVAERLSVAISGVVTRDNLSTGGGCHGRQLINDHGLSPASGDNPQGCHARQLINDHGLSDDAGDNPQSLISCHARQPEVVTGDNPLSRVTTLPPDPPKEERTRAGAGALACLSVNKTNEQNGGGTGGEDSDPDSFLRLWDSDLIARMFRRVHSDLDDKLGANAAEMLAKQIERDRADLDPECVDAALNKINLMLKGGETVKRPFGFLRHLCREWTVEGAIPADAVRRKPKSGPTHGIVTESGFIPFVKVPPGWAEQSAKIRPIRDLDAFRRERGVS